MSLPAVIYKDHLEIAFVHSNKASGSKTRQLIDLNGSHRAVQLTMGGTVNSKVNDAGLLAMLGNIKTLMLEASAPGDIDDILANDNDIRLDIQMLEAFGPDIVNVQEFAQSVLAMVDNPDMPMLSEQIEKLSVLIQNIADLRQMAIKADTPELKAAMQARVAELITEVMDVLQEAVNVAPGQVQPNFSPSFVLEAVKLVAEISDHFGVEAQFAQQLETIQAHATILHAVEQAVSEQQQAVSLVLETLQDALQDPALSEEARVEIEAVIDALTKVQEGEISLDTATIQRVQKLGFIETIAPMAQVLIQVNDKVNKVMSHTVADHIQPIRINKTLTNNIAPTPVQDVIRSEPINFVQRVEQAPLAVTPAVLITALDGAAVIRPTDSVVTAVEKALPVKIEQLNDVLRDLPADQPVTLNDAKEIMQHIVEIEARINDLQPERNTPEIDALKDKIETLKEKLNDALPPEIRPEIEKLEPVKPSCGSACDCYAKAADIPPPPKDEYGNPVYTEEYVKKVYPKKIRDYYGGTEGFIQELKRRDAYDAAQEALDTGPFMREDEEKSILKVLRQSVHNNLPFQFICAVHGKGCDGNHNVGKTLKQIKEEEKLKNASLKPVPK